MGRQPQGPFLTEGNEDNEAFQGWAKLNLCLLCYLLFRSFLGFILFFSSASSVTSMQSAVVSKLSA
jgi:hypothetical protein